MDTQAVAAIAPPPGLPFQIRKIGHVVLHVKDIPAATKFYADALGFKVSDVYGDDLMPGGAVLMRLGSDHHGVALFQASRSSIPGAGMNHMAFEVGTLDEVIQARNHLRRMNVDGNAESVYYVVDDSPAYTSVNKMVCSSMIVLFGDNKVEGIRFFTQPKATMTPMRQADHDALKMKGFKWDMKRRPKNLKDL